MAGPSATTAAPWRTSATEDLVNLPQLQIAENILKATLAPGSVTTFVLGDIKEPQ